MYNEVKNIINDPIAIDSFYLEMWLSNDPFMSRHAEDYNLMVIDMVKGSQQRGALSQGLGGRNATGDQFYGSIGTELLGSNR